MRVIPVLVRAGSGVAGASLLITATVAVLATGATPSAQVRSAPVAWADPSGPNPFTGAALYVAPWSSAATAAASTSDPAQALALSKVASGSHADWFGDWNATGTLTKTVSNRVTTVTNTGALPVLVAYNIPQRDCGGLSAGGAKSAADYRAWVDAFAAGVGSRKAVVVLEPDALAGLGCLSATAQSTRYSLLSYAVKKLNSYPAIATYLDAGHSGWQSPATMAERLKKANVLGARGFALNVSNFRWTGEQITYGRNVSSRIGWKRFVIDTSRNGLGPASGQDSWCNPKGRALGAKPLSPVADKLVDALLWVKAPGESDGDCGRGEPAAGVFWPEYAVGLAERANW